MIPIPRAVSDVTAEWLAPSLSVRAPGTEVGELTHTEIIHGSLTKVGLQVGYRENPHRLPEQLSLKAAMEDHGMAVTMRPEALFYEIARPRIEVNAPVCHYAGHDETDGVVVLEDLRAAGATMADASDPMSVDAARDALDQLASLHASWWGDGRVPGIPEFAGANAMGTVLMEGGYWETCLDGPAGALLPVPFRDRERMAEWIGELWALDDVRPVCFCHGDAHLANTYVDADGRPGFLDWGGVKAGHWAREVCYFLVGALGVQDRRDHEQELLRGYLRGLLDRGADPVPGWEDAWSSYRRHVVHGLLWFLCPTQLQPIEVILANVERFGTAATDHRVERLFEA